MPGCPVFLLGWDDFLYGQWGEAAGVDFDITKAINTVSKCTFVSRSWNYALDWWLSIWMKFLQDLRVVIKGLRPDQELVRVGRVANIL